MFSNLTEEGCIKGLDERFFKKRVERLKNIDIEQIMITSDQKRFIEIQQLYTIKEYEKAFYKTIGLKYLWEARICYVYGYYDASIVMCGASIEAILKLELEREGINTKDKGINYMNNCALKQNIITKKEWNFINAVRKARNEIVHLKYSNLKNGRDFACLLSGDVFASGIHQDIEKKMRKKIRNVIDKTQKIIDYFSGKY